MTDTETTAVDPMLFRLLTMRRGLILKIDTGMNLTRISVLSAMQRDGLTNKRTMRGALRDINGYFVLNNVPLGDNPWSKKYPGDKPTKWEVAGMDENGNEVYAPKTR